MNNFEEKSFNDIFDFPSISAGITAEFIHNHKGNIPVYGSRKDGKPIGYIKDNLNIKYFKNCLSWNRNGSVGYVFYRDHKFATTDDHRPMIIKKEIGESLDISFLRFTVQQKIFDSGFAWNNKAGVDKLKLLYLPVPIRKDGKLDLIAQKMIAAKYSQIENLQQKIDDYLHTLSHTNLQLDNLEKSKMKCVMLKDKNLFEIGIGKRITKKFLHTKTKGAYPAYSANVYNEFGWVDELLLTDFSKPYILWGIDGDWMTRFIEKNKPFVPTDHCGFLQCSSDKIDLKYLSYILFFKGLKLGFSREYRSSIQNMGNVEIFIPINDKGDFDLEKQVEIAKRYEDLENKKSQLIEMLKQIKNTQVNISLQA